MITGSNGVGKTAIARVLAGLWAPSGPFALVYTPPDAHSHQHPSVFVVPQRAYMVAGSLLDQIIYPHTYAEFVKSGRTLEELEDIMEKVFLRYLPEREGGWTTRKEWRDVLSGGEKQRVCTLCPINFTPGSLFLLLFLSFCAKELVIHFETTFR